MNKKQAVAYGQVTLNYMLSSKYPGELNALNFSIEMKQAFRLYPADIIVSISEAQVEATKQLLKKNNGSDIVE